MKFHLEYGVRGKDVDLPDTFDVTGIRSAEIEPVENPASVLAGLCRNPGSGKPLAEIASGAERVCIVVPDHTRPVPGRILVPPMIDALEEGGVKPEDITVLIGTGMHRPSKAEELEWMIGDEVSSRVRVVCHDHRIEGDLVRLGELDDGTPVVINRALAEADFGVTLSLVEPHLMAGFSGGAKAVCPGVCGLDTLKVMHSAAIVDHPLSKEGVIEGNLLQEGALKIAGMAGIRFSVNVTLDRMRRITGIFAGETEFSRREAIGLVERQSIRRLGKKFDAVVTTGAGRPLDATLYQSIKGAHGALQVLKEGGTILLVSSCREGLGSDDFREMLRMQKNPEEFLFMLRNTEFFRLDQWMAQHLAVIRSGAELILASDELPAKDIADVPFRVVQTPEEGFGLIAERHGRNASVLVVPEGSYLLPLPDIDGLENDRSV